MRTTLTLVIMKTLNYRNEKIDKFWRRISTIFIRRHRLKDMVNIKFVLKELTHARKC